MRIAHACFVAITTKNKVSCALAREPLPLAEGAGQDVEGEEHRGDDDRNGREAEGPRGLLLQRCVSGQETQRAGRERRAMGLEWSARNLEMTVAL